MLLACLWAGRRIIPMSCLLHRGATAQSSVCVNVDTKIGFHLCCTGIRIQSLNLFAKCLIWTVAVLYCTIRLWRFCWTDKLVCHLCVMHVFHVFISLQSPTYLQSNLVGRALKAIKCLMFSCLHFISGFSYICYSCISVSVLGHWWVNRKRANHQFCLLFLPVRFSLKQPFRVTVRLHFFFLDDLINL